MSRRVLILLIAGVSAALALVGLAAVLALRNPEKTIVQAQTTPIIPNGASGVSVAGSGVATVKPDVVKFSVGVEVRAQTVTDGQAQAAAKSEAITTAIKGQGVKPEDIVTTSYDISPNYIYNNGQAPRLDGYIVRSQLGVTVRDVSKAGTIIDAVGKAGANLVGGISFTLDNNDSAVKQARQAAMADAKAKAEQLAQLGGFALGGIVSVTESGGQPPKPAAASDGARAVAASAPVAPDTVIESGQFKVIVNVQVVYAIK